MTPYRVEFRPEASLRTRGIPDDAFLELIKVLQDVAADPYGPLALDSDAPHVRTVVFARWGLAEFVVDDAHRVIHVFEVIWRG